jgi:hypothetical protein
MVSYRIPIGVPIKFDSWIKRRKNYTVTYTWAHEIFRESLGLLSGYPNYIFYKSQQKTSIVKEAEEEKSCLKYKKGPFEFMFPNFSLHKRFIIIRETLSGERRRERERLRCVRNEKWQHRIITFVDCTCFWNSREIAGLIDVVSF